MYFYDLPTSLLLDDTAAGSYIVSSDNNGFADAEAAQTGNSVTDSQGTVYAPKDVFFDTVLTPVLSEILTQLPSQTTLSKPAGPFTISNPNTTFDVPLDNTSTRLLGTMGSPFPSITKHGILKLPLATDFVLLTSTIPFFFVNNAGTENSPVLTVALTAGEGRVFPPGFPDTTAPIINSVSHITLRLTKNSLGVAFWNGTVTHIPSPTTGGNGTKVSITTAQNLTTPVNGNYNTATFTVWGPGGGGGPGDGVSLGGGGGGSGAAVQNAVFTIAKGYVITSIVPPGTLAGETPTPTTVTISNASGVEVGSITMAGGNPGAVNVAGSGGSATAPDSSVIGANGPVTILPGAGGGIAGTQGDSFPLTGAGQGGLPGGPDSTFGGGGGGGYNGNIFANGGHGGTGKFGVPGKDGSGGGGNFFMKSNVNKTYDIGGAGGVIFTLS